MKRYCLFVVVLLVSGMAHAFYHVQMEGYRLTLLKYVGSLPAEVVEEISVRAQEVEEALEVQKAAQQSLDEVSNAEGLVKHAKVYWIGKAKKKHAEASAALKVAETEEEKRIARVEMAKWEQNRKDGEAALVERQAKWDAIKGEHSKRQQALEAAIDQVEEARRRVSVVTKRPEVRAVLEDGEFDLGLASFVAMKSATPKALDAYAAQSHEHRLRLMRLFSDGDLLLQMAIADGPRKNRYGKAIEIYEAIQASSDHAGDGVLQRLAVAISLEHAEPRKQRNPKGAVDAPEFVDPVARYLAYEKAFLNGELDPHFEQHDVWSLRFVVNGEEPDETAVWGREMLWNYRPDHIRKKDHRWRYVMLVRTDVPYGSQDNKYDRDNLQFFQNILMNGGVCGRRAFIGRFILRSFGVPTIARPSPGHGALARWTPDGWVVCLGPGWGKGRTKLSYGKDLNFLASAQARALGEDYLQVQRAFWIGDLMGERRSWGIHNQKHPPEFWNTIALYTQKRLIAEAEVQALEAAGEEFGEQDEAEFIPAPNVETPQTEDRKITIDSNGVITVPAEVLASVAGKFKKIRLIPSVLGGKQLLHPRQAKLEPFGVTVSVPEAGLYDLNALVVTPSWKQNLLVSVNGASDAATIPLPHTVGRWEETEPVRIELDAGENALTFLHQTDAKPKGFAIHSLRLIPR